MGKKNILRKRTVATFSSKIIELPLPCTLSLIRQPSQARTQKAQSFPLVRGASETREMRARPTLTVPVGLSIIVTFLSSIEL